MGREFRPEPQRRNSVRSLVVRSTRRSLRVAHWSARSSMSRRRFTSLALHLKIGPDGTTRLFSVFFSFFFFLTGSCRFSPLPKKMEFRGRKKIGRGGNKKTARRWFLLCFVFLAIAASCGDTPKSLHPPSPQNKNKRQTIH